MLGSGPAIDLQKMTILAKKIIFSDDRIISRRADVVWPPQSCDFTLLDYYLWDAFKDKC